MTGTASLWPEIKTAYDWIHRAAHLLANHEQHDAFTIRQDYQRLLHEMAQGQADLPSLSPAIDHFLKVTTSYAPGLFHCYTVPDLPRTNNDLEQYFGSARYLERRATGRKNASSAFVVRGPVRVVAAVATSHQPLTETDLHPVDLAKWRQLRSVLQYRHDARRAQLRFRRDPQSYLARLEERLLQPGLPP